MKKALIGYGGHAHEVMSQIGCKLTCFVEDEYLVDGTKPLSSFDPQEYELMVAIGNPKNRADIVRKLPKETQYFTWIHPTAIIMNNIHIGYGSFIGAYCILTTNITIGNHALLNRGNHIGHNSVIGDYFSAMPGAIVSGNVTIGDGVYLGSNSCIKEKTKIGSLITIGMNTAVVKDLIDTGIYGGVPAKKIK